MPIEDATISGLTFLHVNIDARDPLALASFWAQAFDGAVEALDDDRVRVTGGSHDGPALMFVRSADPRPSKNRLHIDLRADDRAETVERLVGLGASVHAEHPGWTVLVDPDGNVFCIT